MPPSPGPRRCRPNRHHRPCRRTRAVVGEHAAVSAVPPSPGPRRCRPNRHHRPCRRTRPGSPFGERRPSDYHLGAGRARKGLVSGLFRRAGLPGSPFGERRPSDYHLGAGRARKGLVSGLFRRAGIRIRPSGISRSLLGRPPSAKYGALAATSLPGQRIDSNSPVRNLPEPPRSPAECQVWGACRNFASRAARPFGAGRRSCWRLPDVPEHVSSATSPPAACTWAGAAVRSGQAELLATARRARARELGHVTTRGLYVGAVNRYCSSLAADHPDGLPRDQGRWRGERVQSPRDHRSTGTVRRSLQTTRMAFHAIKAGGGANAFSLRGRWVTTMTWWVRANPRQPPPDLYPQPQPPRRRRSAADG